jgi:hypothetical protein
MRGKALSEVRGIDEPIRQAVLKALGGHEPDNFIQSALGGAYDGPPNPRAEEEDLELMQELDEQLEEEIEQVTGDGDDID